MVGEPLYEDKRIKIDYNPRSVEDHVLWIDEVTSYHNPRGVLR